MATSAPAPIAVGSRLEGFAYAIRSVVAEAKKVEESGRPVTYLNIGDPVAFGFRTPPHLVEAVERAMREGANGYTPAAGVWQVREAVAASYAVSGLPIGPDRVILTSGTSEGIELVLSVLVNTGDEVLVPVPTYPFYTATVTKLGARGIYYRTDPSNAWMPDLDHIESLIGPATRALVVIDPNNPTGAVYSEASRRELLELADTHGIVVLADEVYADLAYDAPVPPIGSLNPDAPVISFSSISKTYQAPGWRAGWLGVSGGERLDAVLGAIKELADGRLCSTGPMQFAIMAALTSSDDHKASFLDALRERAEVTTRRLNGIEGISCVPPKAAFYAMPKVELPPGRTDEDYVFGLLRETGLLCVHGSGFGTAPGDGYLRIVFLAPPQDLEAIYDKMATFTAQFRAAA
ncbi:MAG: aminotransferase class I/II-fold pyridoxal phosphate-dependent enzyme [Vicinamibacterales bacterium]|nr:aminotransferase class I/II-fold pyridoxal phosphate-dependent enzyme [Vicinamibacterales bacterium]